MNGVGVADGAGTETGERKGTHKTGTGTGTGAGKETGSGEGTRTGMGTETETETGTGMERGGRGEHSSGIRHIGLEAK